MELREYIKHKPLLFDGAMGTYFRAVHPEVPGKCELANCTMPNWVAEVHRAYLDSGARAIKTNTFAANTHALECDFDKVRTVIQAAWKIANVAAKPYRAFVFADIGPITDADGEYNRIVDVFLELGAKNFLFETLADDDDLYGLAAYIKAKCPDAFLIASFAATPDGFTRKGLPIRAILERVTDCPLIDAAGLNCVSGPNHLLAQTRANVNLFTKARAGTDAAVLSVMPNAGYPTIVDGRTFFENRAAYFAARMVEIVAAGAKIIGGCCGTTPEHIRLTAEALSEEEIQPIAASSPRQSMPRNVQNRLASKLKAGKRVIAVELDPPADANLKQFMDGAKALRDAGVDAVTIADCPIARARADSSMLAAKLHRELGIDPIPHMTCRDRNINATKALLLGLSAEEVHNVLVVTGDPIPSAERDEVKGVFSFNSAVLAGYIRELGEQGITAPFRVFGALNVNAANFEVELRKAKRKEEQGVAGFLTQPVFTSRAFENLIRAHEELDGDILGGVIPIVSHRNALFMNNEISGIEISQGVIDRYEGLNREQAEDLAVELCVGLAQRMQPYTAGWYFITPFQRVGLITRILEELKKSDSSQNDTI